MSSFTFSKLVPSGNPTLILHDPQIDPAQLPVLSARLMEPMHIQAEQAGALYLDAPPGLPGVEPPLPHLQMMGGEFCVNAARCAALLLARRGRLRSLPAARSGRDVRQGELTVSGMDRPLPVLVAATGAELEDALLAERSGNGGAPLLPATAAALRAVRACCAVRVDAAAPGVRLLSLEKGVTLVRMPGIAHLLVDVSAHPPPDFHSPAWKTAGAAWRKACGLTEDPASGVVWYERRPEGYSIRPAVRVAATETECLESACGSASLAMALAHRARREQESGRDAAPLWALEVFQPSGGSLRVIMYAAAPEDAWISGVVHLAAQGEAYL
jgi:diaminopimelate epimerase